MIQTVNIEGAKAIVRITNVKFLLVAVLAAFTIVLTGCPKGNGGLNPGGNTPPGGIDPNATAATVNGTAIKLEEVERAIKQQAQGQESKLSQLELTQARLQVLEQLIQGEVMFQKAKAEGTIPSDEDVTAEINKMKTSSGVSKEEWEKRMKEAGVTDEVFREQMTKQLAVKKLMDKVTGKVEPPSDSEIEAFYNGNKEAFVKKRGVKLAAIVVDPRDTGENDTTKDEESAKLKVQEILKKLQGGSDFATVATEFSEDPSRLRKGELGNISEEQMKQSFSPQIAQAFMSKQFEIGSVTPAIPIAGKYYIFKLQERFEKDEDQTLESPGVRQSITDNLVNGRKQILQASYAAVAMDEADIKNYLAQKVVDNPNELSGARPASSDDDDKKDEKSDSNSNTEKKDDADAKKDEKSDEKKADDKSDEKKAEAESDKDKKADDKKDEEKK